MIYYTRDRSPHGPPVTAAVYRHDGHGHWEVWDANQPGFIDCPNELAYQRIRDVALGDVLLNLVSEDVGLAEAKALPRY